MTETQRTGAHTARLDYVGDEEVGSGWATFAGTMLMLVGSFQVINGLVALFKKSFYLVGPNGLVVNVNYTTWGWVHLGLGVLAVAAGFAVFFGSMWARVVGITLAVLSAIVNLSFVAAYPWWSMIVIALDILVIYALAVHGRAGANA
jgi:hypothetical protein